MVVNPYWLSIHIDCQSKSIVDTSWLSILELQGLSSKKSSKNGFGSQLIVSNIFFKILLWKLHLSIFRAKFGQKNVFHLYMIQLTLIEWSSALLWILRMQCMYSSDERFIWDEITVNKWKHGALLRCENKGTIAMAKHGLVCILHIKSTQVI